MVSISKRRRGQPATGYWVTDLPYASEMGETQTYELPKYPRKNEALANKKYVQRCMRTLLEKKTVVVQNVIGNAGAPTSAGRVDPIQSFNIIQGTGDGNRTGNFIQIDKVTLRFSCTLPTGTPTSLYRVVVFADRQTNGATPAVTDVIETGTGGIAAGYNDDNVTAVGGGRFRILRDLWFSLSSGVGASDATSASVQKAFTCILKGPFKVHYDATAAAITDIVSGEIFVLTAANGTAALVQAQCQIQFVDA